jgi:hypothetical protein
MDDNNCYTFELNKYDDGVFNTSIDATYIMHLEGNGRLDNIKNQLKVSHPTNIVYIVFDKGFKKCKKNIEKETELYDIVYCYTKIFKHAQQNKLSNILILEDDFSFNPEINNSEHTVHINKFINDHKDEEFVYSLGMIPFIHYPYDKYTRRIIVGGALHAVVYSKKAQLNIIQNLNNATYPEIYIMLNIKWYMYYKPLCYQLFPVTNNSKNWIMPDLFLYVLSVVKLDKQVEPGTSLFYNYSNSICLIIFLIFLFIIYTIVVWIVSISYNSTLDSSNSSQPLFISRKMNSHLINISE